MAPVFFDIDPTTSNVLIPRIPAWHSLYDADHLAAAMRPVRAADVRPGDRWVGTLDTARYFDWRAPLGRLRGYWGYEFTATPVPAGDDRVQLCVWEGDPYVVPLEAWMLVVPLCRSAAPGGTLARNAGPKGDD